MEKLKLSTSIHTSECCIAQSSLGPQPYLSGHQRWSQDIPVYSSLFFEMFLLSRSLL